MLGDEVFGGRYRLLRQLGEGGMGQVWEARDEVLGRLVAVKVIALLAGGGSRGDEARTRFLREARITAALQHPNVVTIHDLGEADVEGGRAPFLVMEHLRGEGLDAVVRRGPAALPDVARWGAQICDALADAHAARVLHRDIKPSNVLVTAAGAVKVLDFGIARSADPYATSNRLTQTGFIVGTPPYMAPEQARGRPEERSDLYALGCVLFELITGRLPFEAPDTVGYLTAHLMQDPPVPSQVAPHIPRAWDELVLTLLRKEPAQRYASAADVAHALRRLEDGGRQEPSEEAGVEAAVRARRVAFARALRRLESRRRQEQTAPRALPEAPTLPAPAKVPPGGEVFSSRISPGQLLTAFGGRLLIAAAILGAWGLVVHVVNPQETWAFEGPDWFIVAIAVAVCGWSAWQSARGNTLVVTPDGLRVGAAAPGRNTAAASIPWTSLEGVALAERNRRTEVVLWFRPGRHPSAEEARRHGFKRYSHPGGYIVFRTPSETGPGGTHPYRDWLRTALAECAGAQGVELIVGDW
ncbi:serine/threonine-protein kinase [Streptomyces sp. NPDC002825]|uniref:serine/threonine-protein kinase n=1 Tax=Streptomyces sp. NPDC002825 TaxID=3154666 RepID=UPI00332887A7